MITDSEMERFEDWCYDRYSKNTVLDTKRKIRYLSKKTTLQDREACMAFLRDQRRQGAPPKKINEHIKYLNRWLEFLGEDKILYLKSERRSYKVRFYDHDQVKVLLGMKLRTSEERRNHAMLLLALNTGLRRAEICNLRVSDIHPSFVSVISGKGGKDRDVYLDEFTRGVIKSYIPVRNSPDSPYLFTTRNGKISPEYMGKIADQIRKTTGIEFSWHKCRHTYAKHLLRSDVDLETIRQMLGHADLSTTQVYSSIDTGEALERIRAKNPKFFKGSIHGEPWYFPYGLEGNPLSIGRFAGVCTMDMPKGVYSCNLMS